MYRALGRLDEAEAAAAAGRAIGLNPADPIALLNYGIVLSAPAPHRRAVHRLRAGAGARLAAARRAFRPGRVALPVAGGGEQLPKFTGPQWDGSDLGERTLLLFADQGFGDANTQALSAYDLLGAGIVPLGAGSDLTVNHTLGAGESVQLTTYNPVLLSDSNAAYGTIGGFNSTDTIDLTAHAFAVTDGITLLAGNTLEVTPLGSDPLYLHLSPTDNFAGDVFGLRSDGAAGTDIVVVVPAVTSVTASPSTAILGTGGTATLTLTRSGALTVSGTPTLLLNDGGVATFDAAASTATSLVQRFHGTTPMPSRRLNVVGWASAHRSRASCGTMVG